MGTRERAVILTGVLAVLGVGWAMANLSYDIWGALVMAPLLVAISLPLLRRAFADDRTLLQLAWLGMAAKLVGCAVRYWVAFDAYGGVADAGRYHDAGRLLAGAVRDGTASVRSLVPTQVGTKSIEKFTALLYTFVGSSKLAGFVFYAFMGYWGAVLFVMAARLAVPALAHRRYAVLVFFAPSMVFWPSSIGKEAAVMLCLGGASYGIARLLTGRWRGWSIPITVVSLGAAGMVRPHFAAIWAGALVVALMVSALTGSAGRSHRSRVGPVLLALLGAAGTLALAAASLKYLDPARGEVVARPVTDRITSIFDETTRRTQTGGSSFGILELRTPLDYPWAVLRTLTRPFVTEAHSASTLLPGLEMTALLVLLVASWRRVVHLPRLILRIPYITFVAAALVAFGLAFSTIGNLAILVRQRSLMMPFLLLLACVPTRQQLAQYALGANAEPEPTVVEQPEWV